MFAVQYNIVTKNSSNNKTMVVLWYDLSMSEIRAISRFKNFRIRVQGKNLGAYTILTCDEI